MKKLFILALLALAGCTDNIPVSPVVARPEGAVLEVVASKGGNFWIDLYAVTVDGQQYLIAQDSHGISICPAPKK